VGSALINAMVAHLYKQGLDQFCLDSGYKRAQKRWLRKFGEPYKVVKDYWGPDIDNMIWLCKVIEGKMWNVLKRSFFGILDITFLLQRLFWKIYLKLHDP